MQTSQPSRRGFLAGTLGFVLLGAAACGGSSDTSTGSSASAGTATASSSGGAQTLESLVSEVKGKFKQYTYNDTKTGKSLPYNLYVPADYDSSKSYPLV